MKITKNIILSILITTLLLSMTACTVNNIPASFGKHIGIGFANFVNTITGNTDEDKESETPTVTEDEVVDEFGLIEEALEARKVSYCPYSGFSVGAALLTEDGKVHRGCNIESASYSPSNCAERTAFYRALSEGESKFKAIAVVGGKAGEQISEYCPPCGVCRQVMREFCNPKTFKIIVADTPNTYKVFTLEELLPLDFGPDHVQD